MATNPDIEPVRKEPKTLSRRSFLKFAGAAAVVIAGGACVPQLGLIDKIIHSVEDQINAARAQTETFTNGEESGVISKNNTFPVTLETANTVLENLKRLHLADETTLLFPLKFPEGWNGVIPYEFVERSIGFDPKTGKPIATADKNRLFLKQVPKGTEILVPTDGIVLSQYTGPDGLTSGLTFQFQYHGQEYTLKVGGLTADRILKPRNDLPDLLQAKKAVPVTRWQPVATILDNTTIQISYTSTPIGSQKNLETPVGINFLTATDNKPTEKLLVPKN